VWVYHFRHTLHVNVKSYKSILSCVSLCNSKSFTFNHYVNQFEFKYFFWKEKICEKNQHRCQWTRHSQSFRILVMSQSNQNNNNNIIIIIIIIIITYIYIHIIFFFFLRCTITNQYSSWYPVKVSVNHLHLPSPTLF